MSIFSWRHGSSTSRASASGASTGGMIYTEEDTGWIGVGDGTTPVNSLARGLNATDLKKRAISPTDYGAKADSGTTDNFPLIMQAITDVLANGRALYLPKGSGFYDLSHGIIQPQGIMTFGDGAMHTKVRYPSTDIGLPSQYPYNVPWMMGTYLSGQAATGSPLPRRGAYQETGYQFQAALPGQNVVRLTNLGDATTLAAALAAGNKEVMLEGPIPGPVTGNLPNECNQITAVDTGTGNVTFAYALTDDYTTGLGATSTPLTANGNIPGVNYIHVLNTGTLVGPYGALDRNGNPGPAPYLDFDNVLQGMSLITNSNNGVGLSIAAARCLFRDLHITGNSAMVGDPISRCRFEDVTLRSWKQCYQGAYASHDNTFVNLRQQRIAPPSGVSPQYNFNMFFVQNLEGAKSHRLINPETEEYVPNGAVGGNGLTPSQPTIYLGNRGSILGGKTVAKKDSSVGIYTLDDCLVADHTIHAGTQDGLRLGGQNTDVDNVRVIETTNGNGIRITGNYNRIKGVALGKAGARTPNDTILDQGIDNYISSDCTTYSTLVPRASYVPTAYNSTSETIFSQQTAPQGQTVASGAIQAGQGWRIRISGTKTGNYGIAKIRVAITVISNARAFVAELDIPQYAPNAWYIEGTIVARGGTTSLGGDARFSGFNGAVMFNPTMNAITTPYASWTSVYLSVQNGNANDTMTINEWSLEPIFASPDGTANNRVV